MRPFAIVALVVGPAYIAASPPAPPSARIVAPVQPRADPQSHIQAEDYPPAAADSGQQGTVGFVLDVGVDGRVSACTITRSSGSSSLDSATCRIMRSRARFTPARDSNGNPAASSIEQDVTWALPEGAPVSSGTAPVAVSNSAPPNAGYGMISNSPSPGTHAVRNIPGAIVNEPVMAIPQDGPGEADLSIWDAREPRAIQNLGRYPSIPECRKAKARLALDPQQRAYCTVAPVNYPDLGFH
jgi:TonB family protein